MPAAITHYYQALRVWNRCSPGNPEKSMDAFLWGAQGPDFLYYHRLLQPWSKNIREIGGRLHHEKPSCLLSAMRDFQRSKGNQITELYLFGFLCHYSLDRTVHPFVYWDVKSLRKFYPGRGDGFLHNQVESVLDGILLRSVTGKLATDFDLKQTAPGHPETMNEIARLYSSVLERLYGIYVPKKALVQSMSDCRRICGILNDRWMIKKPLAETLEKITHHYQFSSAIRGISEPDEFDYANVLHSEWKFPENQSISRKESFFDLFEAAVNESIYFIKEFETDNLSNLTRDIPFC